LLNMLTILITFRKSGKTGQFPSVEVFKHHIFTARPHGIQQVHLSAGNLILFSQEKWKTPTSSLFNL